MENADDSILGRDVSVSLGFVMPSAASLPGVQICSHDTVRWAVEGLQKDHVEYTHVERAPVTTDDSVYIGGRVVIPKRCAHRGAMCDWSVAVAAGVLATVT